jgi:hypothetical protein
MAKDTLLREAIADAEQLRNAAIANARAALEETFSPELSSMISRRLRTEMEDKTSGDGHGSEEGGETDHSVVSTHEQKTLTSSGINAVDNKMPAAGARTSSDIDNPDQEVDKMGEATVPHDGHDPEGEDVTRRKSTHDAKGNLHKEHGNHFATAQRAHSDAMYEDDDEDEFDLDFGDEDELDMEDPMGDGPLGPDDGLDGLGDDEFDLDFGDEDEDEVDLDLEAIIRELEAAVRGNDEFEIEEDISNAARKISARQTMDQEPAGAPEGQPRYVKLGEDVEEEVDLDEILREMDVEDEFGVDEVSQLQAENVELKRNLKEHRDVVRFLKDRINEMGVLNGKLLYTNKLFKKYNLNSGQKLRVVETFDRTNSLREVKLVYATLSEAFTGSPAKAVKSKLVKEGLASRSVGSTRPKTPEAQVINEGDALVRRFQELAGITQR